MFKKLLFHCSLFLLAIPAIHSQQLVFKNIGIENGVPATEVYLLFQDSKGYVWGFTEYWLTAVKAQINPHFMSNSLVAIQQLIPAEQSDKANLYIAKFSQLIRYLLNYSDQSVSSLTNEINMIDLCVELEQLRFGEKFLFVKPIDLGINLNQLYIPALIPQPLIENAIWH